MIGTDNVTVTVTSCGRLDLLQKTLSSFSKHNTYPIERVLVIDDSGGKHNWHPIEEIIESITPNYEIIINPKNIGQYKSLDILYPKVNTKWTFHSEDDWLFKSSGFIEKSLELHKDYGSMLYTVELCRQRILSHPKRLEPKIYTTAQGTKYQRVYWRYKLGGFNQGVGLRKTDTLMRLHPYAEIPLFRPAGPNREPYVREATLGLKYIRELGYRSVYALDTDYIEHIGEGHHIFPREFGHE